MDSWCLSNEGRKGHRKIKCTVCLNCTLLALLSSSGCKLKMYYWPTSSFTCINTNITESIKVKLWNIFDYNCSVIVEVRAVV